MVKVYTSKTITARIVGYEVGLFFSFAPILARIHNHQSWYNWDEAGCYWMLSFNVEYKSRPIIFSFESILRCKAIRAPLLGLVAFYCYAGSVSNQYMFFLRHYADLYIGSPLMAVVGGRTCRQTVSGSIEPRDKFIEDLYSIYIRRDCPMGSYGTFMAPHGTGQMVVCSDNSICGPPEPIKWL